MGGSGIFINNFLLYLFVEFLKLNLTIAGNLAIFLTIFYVFILNDVWTFKNRKKQNFIIKLIKFYLSRIFGWIIQISILLFLVLLGVQYIIANTIGVFIAFIINYLTSSYWVWK